MLPALLAALLETLLYELPGLALFTREKTAFIVCLLANLITNPPLNLLIGIRARAGNAVPWPLLLALEILVILIEAGIYAYALRWRPRRALGVSATLNTLSFVTGILTRL